MKTYSIFYTILLSVLLMLMVSCEKTDNIESDDPQVKLFKVVDFDGNEYDTIHIGTQVWLKQNLRVTHYRNGEPIANIKGNSQWVNQNSGAWCSYNNDTSNLRVYGCLYNLFAVHDPRGLCPEGWHTPTEAEWLVLTRSLQPGSGGKLKEAGLEHWASPNEGATNSSAFTALPGGKRESGSDGFIELSMSAYFWTDIITATSSGDFPRQLLFDKSGYVRACYNPKMGMSVRCIMDQGATK